MIEAVLYLARHAVNNGSSRGVIRLLGVGDSSKDIALRLLGIARREEGSGDGVQGRRDAIGVAALAVELLATAHIMQRLVVFRLPHVGEA